jgi:hypothetical protein
MKAWLRCKDTFTLRSTGEHPFSHQLPKSQNTQLRKNVSNVRHGQLSAGRRQHRCAVVDGRYNRVPVVRSRDGVGGHVPLLTVVPDFRRGRETQERILSGHTSYANSLRRAMMADVPTVCELRHINELSFRERL